MRNKLLLLVILVFTSHLCFAGILNKISEKDSTENTSQIVYEYGDSSVPPPYHRSYSITLNTDSVHVVVDSYGEILAEKSYIVDSLQFDSIINLLESSNLKRQKKRESQACCGGTSETISWYSKDEKLFSAYVYHCGGDDFGTLRGNIRPIADAMKALIPDLAELTK